MFILIVSVQLYSSKKMSNKQDTSLYHSRWHSSGLSQSGSDWWYGKLGRGRKRQQRTSVEDGDHWRTGAQDWHADHPTLPKSHLTWRLVRVEWGMFSESSALYLLFLNYSFFSNPNPLLRLFWRRPERHHCIFCMLPAWQQHPRVPLRHGKPLPVSPQQVIEDDIIIVNTKQKDSPSPAPLGMWWAVLRCS